MGTKKHPGTIDCYAAAAPDEPIFILRANDVNAPEAVRQWATLYYQEKRRQGTWTDQTRAKYNEALKCATDMTNWKNERSCQACDSGYPDMYPHRKDCPRA